MKDNSSNLNTATMILPLNADKSAQPNTENITGAGTFVYLDKEPAIIVHRIDIPFIGPQDGALEVIGESMAPTYPHGCKVGISRLLDHKLLLPGECYVVIDTNFSRLVRRVYLHQRRWLQLVCDNKDQARFPPSTRDWDQIRAVFRITSIIIRL